jgi:hypothetical protein
MPQSFAFADVWNPRHAEKRQFKTQNLKWRLNMSNQTHGSHTERDLVEVWDKDGVRHVMSRPNATDAIQHHGWTGGGNVVKAYDTPKGA